MEGYVVSIRINPTDCMSVVDVVNQVDGFREGMSFSSAVSLALVTMIETLKGTGTLPVRDGFEFTEMLHPYRNKIRSRRKLEINKDIQGRNLDLIQPRLAVPAVVESPVSLQVQRDRMQLLYDIKTSGTVLTVEEEMEYKQLERLIYK